MDPTEPNEPSYYEIALTSRQVLVAFVLVLTCVLVAFFSGVWIGRGGSEGRATTQVAAASPTGQPPLEDLRFFSEDRRAGAPPATAVAPMAPVTPLAAATIEPRAGRTLAEDVDAPAAPSAAPTRLPAPTLAPILLPVSTPPATVVAPRATPAPTPLAQTVTPTLAPTVPAAPAAGSLYVQVISSREETKAKRIQQDLTRRGFKAFLSPITKDGQRVYRVRIGPFARRDQAQTVLAQVRKTVSRDAIVTDKP